MEFLYANTSFRNLYSRRITNSLILQDSKEIESNRTNFFSGRSKFSSFRCQNLSSAI